ncbi:MAG: nucleotidyltransferase substrate binding protein [Patescibacteria group bacterium]|nr:nucleotidyltransferase substrate binding protein [Patescibacteria group bacterium]
MSDKKRWQMRLEDFEKALSRLDESLSQDKFSDLEKDGVIQRFEFTLELAWKTIKNYLEDQGFAEIASPKKSIKKAFESGLIKEGSTWIEMLDDRNRLSHLYNQKISESIFKNISNKYVNIFKKLLNDLKKEI